MLQPQSMAFTPNLVTDAQVSPRCFKLYRTVLDVSGAQLMMLMMVRDITSLIQKATAPITTALSPLTWSDWCKFLSFSGQLREELGPRVMAGKSPPPKRALFGVSKSPEMVERRRRELQVRPFHRHRK